MSDLSDKIQRRQTAKAVKDARKAHSAKRGITTGKVLKYALLPDIGSRIRDIGKRLGGFAYFLAQIFYSCRLIPAGHPTLQSANIGHFGFSDVIATAAANLQMRRENIDQIVMFGAVIVSMVLLVANGIAIAAYTVLDFGSAMAQTDPATTGAAAAAAGSMFAAPHPETDLALKFLDRVFGTTSVPFFAAEPGAYDSDLGGNAMKDALYHMLGTYSTAMMVIAVIIVLYYAFTIVGESAMTGQPFGKRFNSFWAPIRLVVGLGLLVPLAGGLNTAQYITLYAAKLGSGMASYAWSEFTEVLASQNNLIAQPSAPMVSGLVTQVLRFELCRAIANEQNLTQGVEVIEEDIKVGERVMGKKFRWDSDNGAGFRRGTKSACGELYLGRTNSVTSNESNPSGVQAQNPRAIMRGVDTTDMYNGYTGLVRWIIQEARPELEAYASATAGLDKDPGQEVPPEQTKTLATFNNRIVSGAMASNEEIVRTFVDRYRNDFQSKVASNITQLDNYGWMGAGMFYNQLADLNGALGNVIVNTFPSITGDISVVNMDTADKHSRGAAAFDEETNDQMINAMAGLMRAIQASDNPELVGSPKNDLFSWVIRDIFGGKFLETFRESNPANPMTNIVALGHGLFTKGLDVIWWTIASLVAASAGPIIGLLGTVSSIATGPAGAALGALGFIVSIAAPVIQALAGFMIFAAFLGVGIGVFLYYVIPLLPFVFFFFAVTAWILEVIEAMVGLPLWALAHIRIDGDGLSGQGAQTGYNIIFGIIIRPIVILFGLIVGIILFSAGMMMVKDMFSFYVGSIGDGENHGVDYIVFSGLYAVIAYTLAMLCFKQCDEMPKNIMRWFGVSDARYNDGQPDPAGPMQQTALGTAYIMTQMGQQAGQMAQSVGTGLNNAKTAREGKKAEETGERRHQETVAALRGGGGSGGGTP